jgi:hypothetical protein
MLHNSRLRLARFWASLYCTNPLTKSDGVNE